MSKPIVNIPADVWLDVLNLFSEVDLDTVHPDLAKRVRSVEVPDLSDAAEERRRQIIELANDLPYVDNDGTVAIDADAVISESEGNGCYVSAWVWCPFHDTIFDKQTSAVKEVADEN